MKLHIAVIGCGEFAQSFVPLFQAHPQVESVCVCDIIPEKAQAYAEKFGVPVCPSFEEALADPAIDTVAIFTQRHLHGPMVVKALYAGKHVYSAVPMATTPEECGEIIEAVKATGKCYMMGETCIYYPCSMYCKQAYERGDFGKFVYGESQYFHDLSHFPKNFIEDRPNSALPPFFYPTHSTAMLRYAVGEHAVKVSAVGYRDTEENTPYAVGENPWDNEFSNEFSLMQLSGGGVARISECRRIGYKAPSSFISGFYGTGGSYQFSNAQHLVMKLTKAGVDLTDVSDQVNPYMMTEHKGEADFKQKVANHTWQWNGFSPVQDAEYARLPQSFKDIPAKNGHMASHQLLIDDFCTAAADGKLPRVHAWLAARFTIPGLVAHESAKKGGVLLDIPDYGDPDPALLPQEA